MKMLSILLAFVFAGTVLHGQLESYVIGPGDLLHVKVLESPELEQSARVTDAGTLPLIFGGSVKLVGLTPAQAAEVVREALINSHYLLAPHVSITIDQPATQTVTVLGYVRAPGAYPITTPRSLLDVVALAGGLLDNANRKVTIERHASGAREDVFISNIAKTALDSNLKVYPGDIVMVPKVEVVYMLGDVVRPGGYPMATNDSKLSVLQAVSLAGGTPPTAVPSKARLVRKQPDGSYVEIPLPLSAMQKGKRTDIALQADDIVYVPFSYLRNAFMGITTLLAAASSAAIYQF